MPIKCISDFIFASSTITHANIILVLGGSQPQLMHEAARLYSEGFAPLILPSGGKNPNLLDHDSEWQFLRDVGRSLGVPAEAILKEDQARNTFDNARFSYDLVVKKGISVNKAILVCKAFHARRALLTYQHIFPNEIEFLVAPVPDKRGITKNNWYLDPEFSQVVMEEVRKIGSYFSDKIESFQV